MFGLNPWLLLGIGIAFAVATGGAYLKGHSNGVDSERAAWEISIAKQKQDAAAMLQSETEKTLAIERRLNDANRNSEADHARATADLAAASGKYARLGKLFEQQKSRCGLGRDAAAGPSPAGTGLADPGAREVERDAVVPESDREDFGAIIRDADELKANFLLCADDRIALPGIMNGR